MSEINKIKVNDVEYNINDTSKVSSVNDKTGDVILNPSDIGLGTVFNLKGSKSNVSSLPTTGNTIGDVWYVIDKSVGYIWLNDGTIDRWEELGLPIDLSNYVTFSQLRGLIIDVLNEKFNNKVSDIEMINGTLKKYKFEDGDFDDE